MATTIHSCVAVACDVCKEDFGGSDGYGIAHFDTQADALEAARECEWHVAPNGAAVCEQDDAAHLDAIRAQHAAGMEDGHECWMTEADADDEPVVAAQSEGPRP